MWALLRPFLLVLLLILLFLALVPKLVVTELVLEPGYAVSTVLDCNKPLHGIAAATALHPFALLPRPRSDDILLLDSPGSAFYSLPVPVSQDADISLFSGGGAAGFSDGDAAGAMFDRPRSFAIDARDNVYVADRSNRAIRKISSFGVTTIAGGYSEKTGHIDGPAQNASFSNDFDLVYVPKLCALLISDRGNRLIRQMNLKPKDCAHKSQPGLGAAYVSIIAVLCVLFGSVFGFFARAFFASREVSINHFINKTWKHYQASLGRLVLMSSSDVRSGIANSTLLVLMAKLVNLSLCYLSIVFRNLRLEKRVQCGEPVSLLDSDVTSNGGVLKSQIFGDQVRDLISFDVGMGSLEASGSSSKQETMEHAVESNLFKIDDMISANLSGFADQARQQGQMDAAGACGLVKRRPGGAEYL